MSVGCKPAEPVFPTDRDLGTSEQPLLPSDLTLAYDPELAQGQASDPDLSHLAPPPEPAEPQAQAPADGDDEAAVAAETIQPAPSPATEEADPETAGVDEELPEPDITTKIEIVEEPEKNKISFKVTATEAHGLTVKEVFIEISYRSFDEEKKEWVFDPRLRTIKLIPVIEKGGPTIYQTPIVEPDLKPLALASTDDNWTVKVERYGAVSGD